MRIGWKLLHLVQLQNVGAGVIFAMWFGVRCWCISRLISAGTTLESGLLSVFFLYVMRPGVAWDRPVVCVQDCFSFNDEGP